jgi:hypothetical protein
MPITIQQTARANVLARIAACELHIEALDASRIVVTLVETTPMGGRVMASRTCGDWAEASLVYTSTQSALFDARREVAS